MFAVFCDRQMIVISSSTEDIAVGDVLDLDLDLSASSSSAGDLKIIAYRDQYYAVGMRMSFGYREYKRSDNYTNDVIALIFSPLAKVKKRNGRKHKGIQSDEDRV